MPDAERPDPEARLRAAVDLLVAPYVNIAPPYVLAKLRELGERYYRENEVAAQALRLQDQALRIRSGTEATGAEDDQDAAAGEKV